MAEYQRWKGIMKCYPFEEKRLAKWQPPYIVQPKFDGDRCVNEPVSNTSILLSSEQNIFHSVPHINEQLDDSGLWNLPLDGELYNHYLMLKGGHELIHSIASRSINLHPDHKMMEYWIFDLKIPGMSQLERLVKLTKIDHLPPNIKIAPFWICNSLDEIKEVYDSLVSGGYEGIVIRHIHNFYEEKRSTWLMKFKPKKMDTYIIVGFNEEVSIHGVPKGRLGSLVLSSQTGDTFAVSAGLDDYHRNDLWKRREELIGKLALVHYQHLTQNKVPKGCFDIEVLE